MKGAAVQTALRRLTRLVTPPESPLEVTGRPPRLMFASGAPVRLPPDYLQLTKLYGSGEFSLDGGAGMIAEVYNPRAAAFRERFDWWHGHLRWYKAEEGRGYEKYAIFPESPGLLMWGSSDQRQAYFWLTEGMPERWPLIVMWQSEFFSRYEMPLVVFLYRLVAGELDARFLGDESSPMRLDADRISFIPRLMPPG